MTEAVKAVVQIKFGPAGLFRSAAAGAWTEGGKVAAQVPGISDAAIDAASAFCG